MLSMPLDFDWLAYCFEEESEKHTHVILRTTSETTKMNLIEDLTPYLEEACQLQVDVHKRIETAFGYHIGLGDKHPCEDFVVIKPEGFDKDDYIKKKVMHKPRGLIQNAVRNKYLIEHSVKYLIDEGAIPLEKIKLISEAKSIYGNLIDDDREELPDPIPNPWGLRLNNDRDNKRCHFWIWSKESNRGKTSLARELVSKYRGIHKTGHFDWWCIRKDCDFIILDEYKGGLSYDELNSLCDGTYEFNSKGNPLFVLDTKPIVIIFSNKNIESVYPHMFHLVSSRFYEYELP